MKKLLVALQLTCCAIPAHAQYMVYGVGVSSCQVLNNGQVAELQIGAWVGGYISGANTAASVALKGATIDMTASVDIEVVVGYIKAACRRNPNQTIEAVAGNVIGNMWNAQTTPAQPQRRQPARQNIY